MRCGTESNLVCFASASAGVCGKRLMERMHQLRRQRFLGCLGEPRKEDVVCLEGGTEPSRDSVGPLPLSGQSSLSAETA